MVKQITIKILNGIGILLVMLVLLLVLPLSVPKLLGLQCYGVASESMEPEYGVGGVVYVKHCDLSDLQAGDVITFQLGTATDYVMTHRIVEVQEDGSFLTKGDANSAVDSEPVEGKRIIGKVVGYLPYLAIPAEQISKPQGICMLVIVFAVSLICWMLADILKRKPGKITEQEGSVKGNRIVKVTGIILMAGAAVYLGSVFFQYFTGNAEYDQLEKQVFGEVALEQGVEADDKTLDADSLVGASEKSSVQKAITKLQKENENLIGWIVFEGLDISYPLMQGEDNEYYLNHTFSGEENRAGSIFMDVLNHSNMQDSHTIIYGHNMKNLSMFGRLKYLKAEENYAENCYFTVYTSDATYRYQIFACYDVSEYSDIYTIWYTPDDNFEKRLTQMQRKAYYDTGVEVTSQDKVLTLSTCSLKGSRFVVHAKLLE